MVLAEYPNMRGEFEGRALAYVTDHGAQLPP
jgi:hypothetical protein